MAKPVGITELITTLGDDKIMMQPLNPGVTNLKQKKDFNEVTFATDAQFDIKGLRKIGLVFWIEPEDLDAAKKQLGI